MMQVLKSARLDLWPIITANVMAMSQHVSGPPSMALWFALAICFLASFGFILNDLWDREIDKINLPRHLESASGSTLALGRFTALFFLVLGLATACLVGQSGAMLALSLALGLFAYTSFVRRLLFAPSLLTAVLATSPLWAPLVLWRTSAHGWHFGVVISLAIMIAARETLLDVRDRAGDLIGRRRTLPIVYGEYRAKLVGVVLSFAGAILLVASVAGAAIRQPQFAMIGTLAAVGTTIILVLRPAVETLRDTNNEQRSLQRFVVSSRFGMALFPVALSLLLIGST